MRKIYSIPICFFLLYALLACDSKTDQDHVNAAKGFLALDKSHEAVLELKNALQKNGKNSEARWLLGKVYFDEQEYTDAVKELEHAHKFGKSADKVYPLLSQSLLETSKLEALSQLSISHLERDALATVLAVQGLGRLQSNQFDEASTLIHQALLERPALPYALLAKAKLMGAEAKNDLGTVKNYLAGVIEIDPDNAVAWGILGDIELQGLQVEEAIDAYSKAIENDSNDLDIRYKRALISIHQRDLNSARADVAKLVKLAPKNPGVQYLQGLLSLHDGKPKEAIYFLEFAQQDVDRYPNSLFHLALAFQQSGNQASAIEYLYRYLSIVPDSLPGRKLLAAIKVRNGENNEAEELIRFVVEKTPKDVDAVNLLARALLKKGETQEGVELLLDLSKEMPDSSIAKARAGVGLLINGQIKEGIEYLNKSIKLNPEFYQAHLFLISTYLRQRDYEQALIAAQLLHKKMPGEIKSLNILGRVYLAKGDNEKAKEHFLRVLKSRPSDSVANQNLAHLAIQSNRLDKAKNYYLAILEERKNFLPVLLKLATLSELEEDITGMLHYLEKAIEAHPKAPKPRMYLARYYLHHGKVDRVPMILGRLDDKQKMLPEVLNVYGLSQLARHLYLEAIGTFTQLVEKSPMSPQPHYHLGVAHLGLGSLDDTESEFRKAIKIAPNYLAPRIGLTQLLLNKRDRKNIDEQIKILYKQAPKNPEVLQLMSANARLSNDLSDSLKYSSKAFEYAPTTRNMLVLAHLNWFMGNKGVARKLQEHWVSQHPEDTKARQELAGLYLELGEEDKAVQQYIKIVEMTPGNIVILNNLAWLLRNTQPKQALEYAEQAVELNRDSPLALDTLAMVLLENNKLEKSQRTIARALAKNNANPTIKYHSAMINVVAGNKTEAKRTLVSLLSGKSEFPDRENAEELFKTL